MSKKLRSYQKKSMLSLSPEFVEECQAIVTEAVFVSRWALVEGYWELGKLIKEEVQKHAGVRVTEFTARLAVESGISERTLWYANKLYTTYPDLSRVPEGKNITWNKLITKYLTDSRDEKPEPKKKVVTCPQCHHQFEL